MKKNKLAEYLKAIMSAQASSTEKISSSSTASGSRSTVEPADQLLQWIKEQAFDVNLTQVMERNINSSYGIKDMLKKVDILSFSPEAADFVVELGFLIEQVSEDLLRKQDASTKIEKKMETQAAEWDAATESTTKVEQILEKTISISQKYWSLRLQEAL